ncbi:MAG TPA: S9 family peptidase [Pseudonocardiaceae bacterium]
MTEFDLERYLAIPRVGGLALSPDGTRLVAPVSVVGPDGKKFVTALWELDPAGERAPRRLTRSAPGESHGGFLPDGSLLFTSRRPDPDAAKPKDGEEERSAALWLLPAGGGEARLLTEPPGGVGQVAVARDAGTVVHTVNVLPGVDDLETDRALTKERKDKGVGAQLFEQYPIRYWDHYLGPRQPHLYAGTVPGGEDRVADATDLTPAPGWALENASFDVTPDGRTVVTTWRDFVDDPRELRAVLVALDTATGDRTVLADEPDVQYGDVACSPAGRFVACVRTTSGDLTEPPFPSLWLVDLTDGSRRELTADLDLWPHDPVWSAAGDALFFLADENGEAPLFRLEIAADGSPGALTRLTGTGCWSSPCPSPDGGSVYALYDDFAEPPHARRLDARATGQSGERLPSPGVPLRVPSPGRVESVVATADDGVPVQSWLVLPEGASAENPAPLVVFIHGGPLASWAGWKWRWNPQLMAARGYAVLLPNPALSTGFGQDFIRRGRGDWGGRPYTDIMAATDAAVARPDIDETRTAAMGGSFGGYMSNWVAGHTDRFRCIVTHASLWALDQFHGGTDLGVWWEREFGDVYSPDSTRYAEHSPNRFVGSITTPMLVIHGELDHRVPIAEALRLWTDLRRHGVESKFLYFPDENHWILKPNNVVVWYETVFAWLDQHVLGEKWQQPDLL